jgi:hypothetical protein
MAVDLVAAVEALTINLTRDADWIRKFVATGGDTFPAGCVVEIRWYDEAGDLIDTGTTWQATVTPTEANWNIDKAEVNTLIAAAPAKAKLFYIDGTIDLLWAMANSVTIDG